LWYKILWSTYTIILYLSIESFRFIFRNLQEDSRFTQIFILITVEIMVRGRKNGLEVMDYQKALNLGDNNFGSR